MAILFLLSTGVTHAQTLESPSIEVMKDGTTVTMTWSDVSGVQGYRLHYAPFPYTGPDTIQTIDMGDMASLSATLWDGASFYVAVTAYEGNINSNFSYMVRPVLQDKIRL